MSKTYNRKIGQQQRMGRGGGVHTVPSPRGSGWVNEEGGEVLSRHRTKERAVRRGRRVARRQEVEHTTHLLNGRIGEKNSYGNDPYPPKDGSQGALGAEVRARGRCSAFGAPAVGQLARCDHLSRQQG